MRNIYILWSFLCTTIFSYAQDTQNIYLLSAAERGDVKAQKHISKGYREGTYGFKRNPSQAFRWMKEAAVQGDAEAEYQTGQDLISGFGTPENTEEGLLWVRKSADHGFLEAQYYFGMVLFDIYHDYDTAFPYIQKAALRDHLISFFYYAKSLIVGLGTQKNVQEGLKYLQKILSQSNYPPAYDLLGVLYATGDGVEKDVMKAIELFDRALAHPAVVPEDKIFFLEHKAYVYLELNKLDEVQKIYNLIVSIDATYADAKTRLTAVIKNSVDNNIPETSLKSKKTFAFVIANEDYKRVSPVPFAKNDGNVFAEYCKKTLGVPEKNVYLVENATLGDMKYHVNLIKKIADAFNGEGRVIFYYAGHGIPDESQRASYLLPVDGYGNDATSGYSLESLYMELSNIPAKSVMVFMDACFSGAQRDGGMLVEARGVTIKPKEEMPMGKLVVLSAAQGDETAYPYTEKKHGMFTYYLLKKLQDTKGDTTLGELMDYVTTEVKQQSILQNKKSQTPKVIPAQSVAGVWQGLTLK